MEAFYDKAEKPSSSCSLFLWFLQVIVVLVFCGVVIRMCLIARPPSYTLTNLSVPNNGISVKERDEITQNSNTSTVVFSLVIANHMKAKGIVHDEVNFTLYQNGLVLGKSSLPGFYQGGRSSSSNVVLMNVDRNKLKLGENGDLKVGLETMVRYRILRWTTKRHSINLEAFVPEDQSGNFSIGEEGIKLTPVKE